MSENRLSVYELTRDAAMMLARGSEGFDTDEELSAWQAECERWMELSGDKYVACRVVIDRAEAEEAWLKAEAAKLTERANRFRSVRERVKGLALDLVKSQADVTGNNKVQLSDGSTVTLVKRTEIKVVVDDADDLPTDFVRVTVAPDLMAIKAAHKEGRDVPGASCSEVESYSLRFK